MSAAYKTLAAVSLVLLCGSCRLGPSIESVGPATRPQGTETTVTYRQEGRELSSGGELVAVRDDGLLLLAEEGLTLFGYDVLSNARFREAFGSSSRLQRWPPSERERERVARFARYPFGLSDEVLESLLEALGQDGLIVISP